MTALTKASASRIGLIAVAIVVGLELFNGRVCYHHGPRAQLVSLAFVAVGFLPGLVALFTRNPLRTAGAALLFAPWLVIAFYTDCIQPYQGGGASMIYVAVVMFGLPCAALGALLTGPVMKWLSIALRDG